MKLTISTALLTVLVPAAALAQAEIPTDGVGIYLDLDACYFCGIPAPYAVQTAYLIALNPSDLAGISRWEGRLYTSPDPLLAGLNVTLEGGGANDLAAPDFSVTLPTPMPWSQTVLLATLSTFYLGRELLLGIGPCQPSSVDDPPSAAYLGATPGLPWRRLALATWVGEYMPGAPEVRAAFALNAGIYGCGHEYFRSPWCFSVPTEPQSWGAIKGLHR